MRVRGKNFLSIAEIDKEIPNGVTLIRGYNHDDGTEEGAGKSAIPNLVFWTLTGEMPKDVNVDQVIKEGQKYCEGLVDLPQFSVFRSRGPNDLHIKEKDGKIWRGKDANETQKEIIKRLGMSFKTICQSVYFAQNYPNKFVTANQENKGKILSEILDLDQFDRARKIAGDRIKPLKDDLVKAEKLVLEIQLGFDNAQKNILTYTKLIEEFNNEKMLKIQKMLGDHGKIQDEVDGFLVEFRAKQKTQVDDANEKIQKLKKEIKSFEAKMSVLSEVADSGIDFSGAIKELEEKSSAISSIANEAKIKLGTLESEAKAQRRREKDLTGKESELELLETGISKLNVKIIDAEAVSVECADAEAAAVKAQENPSKESCPTCGGAWDGDPEHYAKEVKKAKADLSRAEKTLADLKQERIDRKAGKKPLLEAISALKLEISEFKPISSQKLEERIAETVKDLKEITAAISEVRKQERQALEAASEINMLKSHVEYSQDEIKDLKQEIESAKEASPDAQLSKFHDRMARLEKEIEAEDAREPKTLQDKLNDAEDSCTALGLSLHVGKDEVAKIQAHINRLEALREGYREVKAYTFENTLRLLNSKANLYLTQLFNQQVKIKFQNEDLKIETLVQIDGTERPLGLYSGGQFRRIALAVDLALADVTLSRKGNTLNLMVLDEYFKDLSATSMGRILKILQARKTPTLLIEHNDLFKSIVNSTIEVELRNGTTTVVS